MERHKSTLAVLDSLTRRLERAAIQGTTASVIWLAASATQRMQGPIEHRQAATVNAGRSGAVTACPGAR